MTQERSNYDAAIDWYKKPVTIKEQLGNRAGMASTLSQIGVLHTQTGCTADAVPLILQSLALRLEIASPEVRNNLYWLSRQRSMPGADAFRALAAQNVDAETLTNLLALLDQYEAARQQAAPPPAASAQPEAD